MKIVEIVKKVLIGVGILVFCFVGVALIASTPLVGEVVTLHTRDADGAWQTTSLWVVDPEGGAYLRAGTPDDSAWMVRLRAHAQARLERGDELREVRLVPEVGRREQVNLLMSEKYGWADAFVGMMGNRPSALPLRIEPAGVVAGE